MMTDDMNTDGFLRITAQNTSGHVITHVSNPRMCFYFSRVVSTLSLWKDTADDATHGPDTDSQADQVDAFAVDVRLHLG